MTKKTIKFDIILILSLFILWNKLYFWDISFLYKILVFLIILLIEK